MTRAITTEVVDDTVEPELTQQQVWQAFRAARERIRPRDEYRVDRLQSRRQERLRVAELVSLEKELRHQRHITIEMGRVAANYLAGRNIATDIRIAEDVLPIRTWKVTKAASEPVPPTVERSPREPLSRRIRSLGRLAVAGIRVVSAAYSGPMLDVGSFSMFRLPQGEPLIDLQSRDDQFDRRVREWQELRKELRPEPEVLPETTNEADRGVEGWVLDSGVYDHTESLAARHGFPAGQVTFRYMTGVMLNLEHGLLGFDGVVVNAPDTLGNGQVTNPMDDQAYPYQGSDTVDGELRMQERIVRLLSKHGPMTSDAA